MAEISKASVLISGFPESSKSHWVGEQHKLPGAAGNNIGKTNLPNIRAAYRHETLLAELDLIRRMKIYAIEAMS
jgi:AMP deaminase